MARLKDVEQTHPFSRISSRKSAMLHERYGYRKYEGNAIGEHEAAVIQMMTSIISANFPILRMSEDWYIEQKEDPKRMEIKIGIKNCFYIQRVETLESMFAIQVSYIAVVHSPAKILLSDKNGSLTHIMHFLDTYEGVWQSQLLATPEKK